MRTLKTRIGSAIVGGLIASLVFGGWAGAVNAQVVASDEPAGLIIFPKVIVDTTGSNTRARTDTLIQITNTNTTTAAAVSCHWIDATGHCGSVTGPACTSDSDCGAGICVPGWSETDFTITLSPGQPLAFPASEGTTLPCLGNISPDPCINFGAVLAVPEIPFRGELKCFQIAANDLMSLDETPAARNDLKGEATIIRSSTTILDTASYNAIGVQATEEEGTSQTGPLCLGGRDAPLSEPCGSTCAKEYAGCPGVLILNHFFEGAASPLGGIVGTTLTLVPCTENLSGGVTGQVPTTVQLLVYNEFEQRFSTSTRVECFADIELADIDSPRDHSFSIFSAGVQGTVTGQTRIRGVEGNETGLGHGLLGVAQESYSVMGTVLESSAFNLNMQGSRLQGDAICR